MIKRINGREGLTAIIKQQKQILKLFFKFILNQIENRFLSCSLHVRFSHVRVDMSISLYICREGHSYKNLRLSKGQLHTHIHTHRHSNLIHRRFLMQTHFNTFSLESINPKWYLKIIYPDYNKILRKIFTITQLHPNCSISKQYNKSLKILQSEKFIANHLVPIKTDFNWPTIAAAPVATPAPT